MSNFDHSNPNVQLLNAALYDPAAEEMVIALVEANDLAHMRGLSRPWPAHAAGACHFSKISTLQLIKLELPAVLFGVPAKRNLNRIKSGPHESC